LVANAHPDVPSKQCSHDVPDGGGAFDAADASSDIEPDRGPDKGAIAPANDVAEPQPNTPSDEGTEHGANS